MLFNYIKKLMKPSPAGSVLCDWEIREAVERGDIKVDPFDSSLINPNSLDVRLGGNFSEVLPTEEASFVTKGLFDFSLNPSDSGKCIDPTNKSTFETVQARNQEEYILGPSQMVIASLLEDITLPDYLCAKVLGKSSLGRLGLDNSSCAGFVDSGWSGVLTIELFNHSRNYIRLVKGMKIGQIIFYRSSSAEKPYGIVGRYQNQKPGQGSVGVS